MGFLSELFTRKTHTVSTINELASSVCEFLRPGLGSPYTDSNSVNMYRSWIYVASTYNAKNVADSELRLYTNKGVPVSTSKNVNKSKSEKLFKYDRKFNLENSKEVLNHPVLDLLDKPNEEDNLYSFLYKLDLFLELTGDAYVLIEKNTIGKPYALYVLFSQFVSIQTDGLNKIIRYNYGVAKDGKYQYSFAPDEIIHFKFFNPADLLYGISPLEACARTYGIISSMDTFEEALNKNMGVPSGMLKYTKSQIKDDDRKIIENKWQQKFASVGRAGKMVVTDQDVTYENLGINPRDMQFLDGRKWSREEIMSCYGIPMSLLITESVNRSNMTQSTINYYHDTINPRLKMISQTLTNQLLNRFTLERDKGTSILLFEKESPLDRDLILKETELLARYGGLTVDELRMSLQMDPLGGSIGSQIAISSNNQNILQGQGQ